MAKTLTLEELTKKIIELEQEIENLKRHIEYKEPPTQTFTFPAKS